MKIVLLSDHPHLIPSLANQWYETLGKSWVPNATIQSAEERFISHLNHDRLPLAYVMLDDQQNPIGMVCLRVNESIRTELTPWLGGLFIHPDHRRRGHGEKLINCVKQQTKVMNFNKLYLLTFDPSLPTWYARLGWELLDNDTFLGKPIVIMETLLNINH